jgi:phospholipid N-methyltransferase
MEQGRVDFQSTIEFERGAGVATSPAHGRMTFFKEFLRSPKELGTCFKSSAALCRAIVDGLGLESARTVIELGAGDGPLTRRILRRLAPACRFFAVERSEALARVLRDGAR